MRRITIWIFFPILFGLMPLIIAARRDPQFMGPLLVDPALLFLAITISAGTLSDVLSIILDPPTIQEVRLPSYFMLLFILGLFGVLFLSLAFWVDLTAKVQQIGITPRDPFVLSMTTLGVALAFVCQIWVTRQLRA